MHCAMCAKTVENALGKVAGVSTVNVNLANEKAYLTFDGTQFTVDAAKTAIESAGYLYLGQEGEKTVVDEDEILRSELRDRKRRILIGFISGILLMIPMLIKISLPFPIAYLMFILAAPVFIYLSHPIFRAAWQALRNHT
jgi:Cu+-exporting ATPase